MLEYAALAMVGCLLGVLTGLTPGLHVNTVCLLGLSVYSALGLDALGFSVAMVAMSVTHTFLDFIPSIFIGVPEEGTSLSILPTHRLVMEGKALEAVKLTAYGCLLGIVFAISFMLPAVYIIPVVYAWLRPVVVYIISAAAVLLILRETGWRGKIWAGLVFVISGALGSLVLELQSLSSSEVLFPVFAGLFGLSGILSSLKDRQTNIPQRQYANVKLDKEVMKGGIFGAIGGVVVGVLPAMSPSQIGIIMSEIFGATQRSFLVSIAAISSSDAIYSLVSIYTIHNPRSGVGVLVSRILQVNGEVLVLFIGVFCFVAIVAAYIHIEIGKRALVFYNIVDYRKLSLAVMLFVIAMVYALTGWLGILIASVATVVGLIPILSNVSRTHLMGVLLVPTIMYFIGGTG
jgi:putative membrane protein